MLNEQSALRAMQEASRSLPRCPTALEGRGIVIPAGGFRYFPSAWVCIQTLRHVGCTLAIELWHLGPDEISEQMRDLVAPLGVTCIDALEVRRTHPVRRLAGWELKPYAMLHSGFKEVLLLDADNVPVLDPAYLFEHAQFQRHGATFWPDYTGLEQDRAIWRLTGVPYRWEPMFESGQMIVDKGRCWEPLALTMWMNEHSDFWYRHVYGDKDTFHMAWRFLDRSYSMPSRGEDPIWGVICQYDFEGSRLFQHRHFHKWLVDSPNPRLRGFIHEEFCHQAIAELERRWITRPTMPYDDHRADAAVRAAARDLCRSRWSYCRDGDDEGRPMAFGLDGRIHEGAAGCEQSWNFTEVHGDRRLRLSGKDGVTCELRCDSDQAWRGNWLIHERPGVKLTATRGAPRIPFHRDLASPRQQRAADRLCAARWRYRRVGFDERDLQFADNGVIGAGQAALEIWWNLTCDDRGDSLWIGGQQGLTCVLIPQGTGRWSGQWLIYEKMPVELVEQGESFAQRHRLRWERGDAPARPVARELVRHRWRYRRGSTVDRAIALEVDGRIYEGAAAGERYWNVTMDSIARLHLFSEYERTCTLELEGPGRWTGRSNLPGESAVDLQAIEVRTNGGHDQETACRSHRQAAELLCGSAWIYRRVGRDMRPMRLSLDGVVVEGEAELERFWRFRASDAEPVLEICGRDGVTAVLHRNADDLWRGRWLIHEQLPVELVAAHGLMPEGTP